MGSRGAFKVPIPKSYNNVTEAKLVQKGSEVWVQLPTNMVQDKRMSKKSVYMQDFNKKTRLMPRRHRNVKAKVVTRRSSNLGRPCEDSLGFPGDLMQSGTKNCCGSGNSLGLIGTTSSEEKLASELLGAPLYDGMSSGSNYSRMKSKRNTGPIAALLPVMHDGENCKSPELSMAHHYTSPRRLSASRSYNEKARDALPGIGKWLENGEMHDVVARRHSNTIDAGDDFLENPLLRSDGINHEAAKRSVSIRSPTQLRHSPTQLRHSPRTSALGRRLHEGATLLDPGSMPITLDPPTFDNSAKRHDLEILTRVDPHSQSLDNSTLGHLYQPVGCTSRPGYTVVGNSYAHENGTFSHTRPGPGSFDICPDWSSERKKSVVIRN